MPRRPESKARLAALVGAALLVTAGSLTIAFVLKPHHTPSGSMLPTVAAGEWFWVYNWAYRSAPVQRGELVVITSPKDPDADYLKRVLAVAGDHLMVKGQFVEVNGKPLRDAGASGEPSNTRTHPVVRRRRSPL